MSLDTVKNNVTSILRSLPEHVQLVAAAKTRTHDEVQAVVRAGVKVIGYNYVQEAEQMYSHIGNKVQWHLIGHLQRNKAKKAIQLFDMIETIDSVRIAETVDKCCAVENKIMPVLVEINSAREENKAGVLPEDVDDLINHIHTFPNIKIQGLMTMGAYWAEAEQMRSYFRETKAVFDRLKEAHIPNVEMRYLSMGMSDSYHIAIEEGANMVRIGTKLFGERTR